MYRYVLIALLLPSIASAAFPTGWGRRCEIVIQDSLIDANLTNFTVLLDYNTLPSEMFSGANATKNDGGDIRFSSDESGSTQLSCEIVRFDTTNNKAEVWVKVASITASGNTSIWVWYDSSSSSQPAEDASYGRESVWSQDFHAVWHLEEDPSGDAPQYNDATSFDFDGTTTGMVEGDRVEAKIGYGAEFDGTSGSDYVTTGDIDIDAVVTISFWAWTSSADNNGDHAVSKWGSYGLRLSNSVGWDFHIWDSSEYSVAVGAYPSLSTWYHVAGVYDGSDLFIFIDGAPVDTTTHSGGLDADDNSVYLSKYVGGDGYELIDAHLDEARISQVGRSEAWIKASYKNQKSPNLFAVEGTPEDPDGEAAAPNYKRRRIEVNR